MGVPYIMAVRMIPSTRFGVYMGIINMMIVIPMLIQSVTFGWIYQNLLGDNPNNAIRFAGGVPRHRRVADAVDQGATDRPGRRRRRLHAGRGTEEDAMTKGAMVTAALLVDGDPAKVLVVTAEERTADLIVRRSHPRPHPCRPATRLDGDRGHQAGSLRRAHRPTRARRGRTEGSSGRTVLVMDAPLST